MSWGCPYSSADNPRKEKEKQEAVNTTVQGEQSGSTEPEVPATVEAQGGGSGQGNIKSSESTITPSITAPNIPPGGRFDPITGRVVFTTILENIDTSTSTLGGDGEEFTFLNKGLGHVLPSWLLLDNESTCNVMRDKTLLSDLHRAETPVLVHSNGGTNRLELKGRFGSVEDVWFDPKSLANILSLGKLTKTHRITFDSQEGNQFVVHSNDERGTDLVFNMSPEGLYYLDLDLHKGQKVFAQVGQEHATHVTTVAENMMGFTKREIKRAKLARDALKMLGFPSTADFKAMVRTGWIRNCPITEQDISNAHTIFGPDDQTLHH